MRTGGRRREAPGIQCEVGRYMQAEGENRAPRRMSERNFTRGATGELSESPRHCLHVSALTGRHRGHCTWRCSQVKDDSIPHSSTSNPVSAARISAADVLPAPAYQNNTPERRNFTADEYSHSHIYTAIQEAHPTVRSAPECALLASNPHIFVLQASPVCPFASSR